MEREGAPLDESERREHDKRVEEYREARKPYWRRVRLRKAEVVKLSDALRLES